MRPLSANALKVLETRYLIKNDEGKVVETPEQLFRRVAKAVALAEKTPELQERYEQVFWELMSNLDFLPNTPTLLNAGREGKNQVLSACFVLPIPDSLEGIFNAVYRSAILHQSGAGTGYSFSRLRPEGSTVSRKTGVSSGPVSFMRVFNAAVEEIKQGNTRRGALMMILNDNHPDILKFVSCKMDETQIRNANISVAASDAFMCAVETNSDWTLSHPSTKETKTIKARELWEKIIGCAWAKGDPGLFFIDEANRHNPVPHIYNIESTNPCFSGNVRLATDHGLLTFGQLYQAKTSISVTTDNRTLGIREGITGAVAVQTSTGTTLRKACSVFLTKKNQPVYNLVTDRGFEVTATSQHKFFTPKGLVELKDLQPGDSVLVQSGTGVWGTSKVLPGQIIPGKKFKQRLEQGLACPPTEWSRELGELLGWVTGDGWVSTHQVNPKRVPQTTLGLVFGLGEKEQLLQKFDDLLFKWTGTRGTRHLQQGSINMFYRSSAFELLAPLGLKSCGGLMKRVPEGIWGAPREAVVGFLSALFGADGTVNITKRTSCNVRLASSSRELLVDVQQLLLNEGIYAKLWKSRKAGQQMMPDGRGGHKMYPFVDQYELIIDGSSRNRFALKIGFLTKDKQKKVMTWINKRSRTWEQHHFLAKVQSVDFVGNEDVYCTTEPTTHSLIANGLVASNCGEVPLGPNEACNLGSINLINFVDLQTKKIDWTRLATTVKSCVRFLDNVIEISKFPFPEIDQMVRGNRKIGLGVMGVHDLLLALEIKYDSEEALTLCDQLASFIQKYADESSINLGEEKGSFLNFKGSTYDGKVKTMRNMTRTVIAPTGTISIIANETSSGIEPVFAFRHKSNRMDTQMNHSHWLVAKWEDAHPGQPLPAYFVESHQIHPEWHLKMQAVWQKYINDAVSKTINLPNSATREDIARAYMLAWKLKCKGVTVYRDGCRSTGQVLEHTKTPKTEPTKAFGEDSRYYELKTGSGELHINIAHREGKPYRLFASMPPIGTEISGLVAVLGITISKYLELGGNLENLIKHYQSVVSDKPLGFGPKKVLSIPHGLAITFKHFLKQLQGKDVKVVTEQSARSCPECHSPNYSLQEGCCLCVDCGYSACS